MTIGIESAIASLTGVTVLVAPGPDVTITTPALPVDLAYPELLIDDVSKHIQQDDMKNIFQKNDFIGLNHYQHIRIKADNKSLLKARGAFNDELPFGLEGKDAKLTLLV